MVRSRWIGALAGALSFLAPAYAEPFMKPQHVVSVQEKDKPARQCKVLRCWKEKDGTKVCEVQALDDGERMTILEPAATTGKPQATARVFTWGKAQVPPPGLPAAPPAATGSSYNPRAEEARPGDPRESWGKLERWTDEDSRRAQQESSRRVSQLSQPAPHVAPASHSKSATAEPPI
ncbi:MAG: hypothetical protein K2W96_14945, partial [Gemmataceae bacterium]|nr:hypothetical protein [Gemmataceae bacterium]